jgi:putative transposase
MPTLVWHYLTALLYYRTSSSCVALADALKTVSHDRLTRLLQADWSGQILLELAVRTLFVRERGYLILDDTVIPKPFATAMEHLAWVYSSQERKPIYGFSLVLLVWTNGTVRVPLGVRLWHKGGASKYGLALELLSYARNRLRCRPEYVLFDAWYPSKALLKRIRDYGWYFVCRLKKNRRFNGQPLRAFRRHPYWAERGWLTGGVKVLVVRYGAKYYATNRLTLPAVEVRRHYRMRAQIEEVIRACKDQLGLSGCQARSERAQLHHITCCFAAFCVLERECQDRGLSIYKLKQHLSCQGCSIALPALKRLRSAA